MTSAAWTLAAAAALLAFCGICIRAFNRGPYAVLRPDIQALTNSVRQAIEASGMVAALVFSALLLGTLSLAVFMLASVLP